MSKNFVSEVRRLKNGSLHTGTLKSITVDVESSSAPDTSALEIVTAENDNEENANNLDSASLNDLEDEPEIGDSERLTHPTGDDSEAKLQVVDSAANDTTSEVPLPDGAASQDPSTSGEILPNAQPPVDTDISKTQAEAEILPPEVELSEVELSETEPSNSEPEGSQNPVSSEAERADMVEISQPESSPVENLMEAPMESQQPASLQESQPELTPDSSSRSSASQSANDYQHTAESESEVLTVESYVVDREVAANDKQVSDLSSSSDIPAIEVESVTSTESFTESVAELNQPNSVKSDSGMNIQAIEASDSAAEIAALKTELQEALHHEERLDKKVAELTERLKQNEKDFAHLKLELGHAQCSNTILSDELAEAKQYILKLTEASQAPSPSGSSSTASPTRPSPLQAQPSQTTFSQEPAASQSAVSHQPPKHSPGVGRSPRPAVISPRRMPSRPIGNVEGLPPMSTERWAGPPTSSRRSPQPSQPRPQPSQPQSHSQAQSPAHSRQPLNLPERQASPSKPATPTPDAQLSSTQIQLSTRKPTAMRRFSRPGLSRLDEEIPVSARDTETKDVKPKLSDAEISWFD